MVPAVKSPQGQGLAAHHEALLKHHWSWERALLGTTIDWQEDGLTDLISLFHLSPL